jgi:putative N6-adenine-specific DNA methylase
LGERPRTEEGGVSWPGDARSLMRANLWLRTASRVIVRVARFQATEFFELEKRAKAVDWTRFVRPGVVPEFRVTTRKSRLYHSDAIAERLLAAAGSGSDRHRGREGTKTQLFVVRAHRDQFEISADSSGELLHLRGYRQAIGKAPLRETLAAALLLASDWRGESPLLDPLCGSGTIAIEGALIARNIAPGLRRNFAFMEWPNFDAGQWRALLDESATATHAVAAAPIVGSDRDAGAIAAASANAERAGVRNDIDLSRRAISAVTPPLAKGLVATNPPYGVRVGRAATVRDLYAQLGHVLRARCAGWQLALYSADERLAAQIGIPLEQRFRTSNGGIGVSALFGTVQDASP